MFRRDDLIGYLLLLLCIVAGVVLTRSIFGYRIPMERIPQWVIWIFVAGFVFGLIWLVINSRQVQQRWGRRDR